MNDSRYQELLGRVLDDEIAATELEELVQGLRGQPDRLADVRSQLALWDHFSQQHRPERSADAFVASWQTRLTAESSSSSFIASTVEVLDDNQNSAKTYEPATQPDKPRGPVAQIFNLLYRRFVIGKASKSSPHAPAKSSRLPGTFLQYLNSKVALRVPRWAAGLALFGPALLVVALLVQWLAPTIGQPVLSQIQGAGLSLERRGQLAPAIPGTLLQPGDTLRTETNTTVEITFAPEKTRLLLHPGSEFRVSSLSQGKHFALRLGKIEAAVARQRPFSPMRLTTPQAEARVLGTQFSLRATTDSTRLEVTEGRVRFTRLADATSVTVRAGNYALAGPNIVLSPLPLTGSILREVWTNIPGYQWVELLFHTNFPGHPDASNYLTNVTALEMPSNWGTNYGQRLRGYFHPPKTGDYTFWIASRDWASLYLSPDDNPQNKVHMANCPGAGPREWEKWPAQRSSTVQLNAGEKYYFEIIHKVGTGPDNLAMAWQVPNRQQEVIPIEYVSPFKTK